MNTKEYGTMTISELLEHNEATNGMEFNMVMPELMRKVLINLEGMGKRMSDSNSTLSNVDMRCDDFRQYLSQLNTNATYQTDNSRMVIDFAKQQIALLEGMTRDMSSMAGQMGKIVTLLTPKPDPSPPEKAKIGNWWTRFLEDITSEDK